MISLMRIDDRLLHGQVALAWTRALQITAIIVANDSVCKDTLRLKAMKMAKPNNIQLVITTIAKAIALLNSKKAQHHRILLLIDNTQDAKTIMEHVKGISSINLGHMHMEEGKQRIAQTICISPEDKENLLYFEEKGIEVDIRQIPNEPKKKLKELL